MDRDLDQRAPGASTVLAMEADQQGTTPSAVDGEGPTAATDDAPDAGSADGGTTNERAFRQLVVNTLLSGVTSSFLWFALTFWIYLETKSVVATGIIGGAF